MSIIYIYVNNIYMSIIYIYIYQWAFMIINECQSVNASISLLIILYVHMHYKWFSIDKLLIVNNLYCIFNRYMIILIIQARKY
jgi:hypothetical protein